MAENHADQAWSFLSSLPRIPIHSLPADAKTCHICTDDYGSARTGDEAIEDAVRLPCPGAHVVGHGCIARWIESGRNNCPMCRYEFFPSVSEYQNGDDDDDDNNDDSNNNNNDYDYDPEYDNNNNNTNNDTTMSNNDPTPLEGSQSYAHPPSHPRLGHETPAVYTARIQHFRTFRWHRHWDTTFDLLRSRHGNGSFVLGSWHQWRDEWIEAANMWWRPSPQDDDAIGRAYTFLHRRRNAGGVAEAEVKRLACAYATMPFRELRLLYRLRRGAERRRELDEQPLWRLTGSMEKELLEALVVRGAFVDVPVGEGGRGDVGARWAILREEGRVWEAEIGVVEAVGGRGVWSSYPY